MSVDEVNHFFVEIVRLILETRGKMNILVQRKNDM